MIDNTVHLPKWYNRKRPKLQIDILACLTLRGELTKGQVEKILVKRHGDILNSFNILKEKKLIKKSGRIFGSGRQQYTYQITRNGIQTLIIDEAYITIKFLENIVWLLS